jgi:3',5'-cyclic AMP phosphodiesterase CpdA
MRIGLISDVHGELAQLEGRLAAVKRRGPDLIVLAGDLVAPGCPQPAESVQLVRSEGILIVPGNSDRYVLDWATPRWHHTLWMRMRRQDPIGAWLGQIEGTQAALGEENLRWLREQPEEVPLADAVWVCHGMPGNPFNTIWPRDDHYDANVSDADRRASLQLLQDASVDLVLCGHIETVREFRDQLPDGRPLRVIRSGPSYALLTHGASGWKVEWAE